MIDITTPIFKLVNSEIDNILKLELDDQFEQLSSLYMHNTRKLLKEQMGTSAGWPWLGEYIFFYTLRKHLQRMLDCEFIISKNHKHGYTGDIWPFVDSKEKPEYILVHNGRLRLPDSKDVRPDIYLYKRNGEKLIFTIDVKVFITWSGALHTALSKLNRTINDSRWKLDKTNRPLGYLMSLDPRFPSNYEKVRKYQQNGVSIVGPRNSPIESELEGGDYPMVTFSDCISQIQSRL